MRLAGSNRITYPTSDTVAWKRHNADIRVGGAGVSTAWAPGTGGKTIATGNARTNQFLRCASGGR